MNCSRASVAAARFDIIELEIIDDPDNVILNIEPDAYMDVLAGNELVFLIEVDGKWVEQAGTGVSEAQLELVADDSITLAQRTVLVEK